VPKAKSLIRLLVRAGLITSDAKFGTDLEVRVDFGGVDVGTKSGMRLFSALELFDMEAGRP